MRPATAMRPISYPGFANLHPFAPAEDARGYRILIDELSDWLVQVSGYAACGLSRTPGPPAVLDCWPSAPITSHTRRPRPQGHLIPSSAHGTNAASAMAKASKVVTVHSAA